MGRSKKSKARQSRQSKAAKLPVNKAEQFFIAPPRVILTEKEEQGLIKGNQELIVHLIKGLATGRYVPHTQVVPAIAFRVDGKVVGVKGADIDIPQGIEETDIGVIRFIQQTVAKLGPDCIAVTFITPCEVMVADIREHDNNVLELKEKFRSGELSVPAMKAVNVILESRDKRRWSWMIPFVESEVGGFLPRLDHLQSTDPEHDALNSYPQDLPSFFDAPPEQMLNLKISLGE